MLPARHKSLASLAEHFPGVQVYPSLPCLASGCRSQLRTASVPIVRSEQCVLSALNSTQALSDPGRFDDIFW